MLSGDALKDAKTESTKIVCSEMITVYQAKRQQFMT